jgi:hypothetical protein
MCRVAARCDLIYRSCGLADLVLIHLEATDHDDTLATWCRRFHLWTRPIDRIPLWSCQVTGAQGVRASWNQANWVLTTVLTTTGPDNLPRYPILQSESCQVSHGMLQCACSLQAEDHGCQAQRGGWADDPATSPCPLRCGRASADTLGNGQGLWTSLARSRQGGG